MKWFLSFAYLFLLILTPGCSEQNGNRNFVEWLSYLDQSPVRIEIADGNIKSVVKIKKLSDPNSKIFIAPGLFDNQVNGYKGVSFVDMGGELTFEGIGLITRSLCGNGVTE